MQQQDIITLLTELKGSLTTTAETDDTATLQKKIAPMLANDLQENVINAASATGSIEQIMAPPVSGLNLKDLKDVQMAFPSSNQLLQQSPAIFKALSSKQALDGPTQAAGPGGASVLHAINLNNINSILQQWYLKFHFEEFISVFLATDTTTPVLLLPVTISFFDFFKWPHKHTSFQISTGSVWILSKLLAGNAPAGTYTGLTVSGGTLSFNEVLPLNNKSIIIPAGAVCPVQLDLQQPVDTTVSPDNIGIDAMNAGVKLPTQFSFNFSTPAAGIIGIADASWQLYGSANTFQYDSTQSIFYNPVLNTILIGCKVTAPSFIVSKCDSPFFTIKGMAPVLDGYWELPVATIDITKTNNATGIGALAVVCSPGLQVNWIGLNGGPADLRLPLISATVGIIGVADLFAGNRYATQHYNLWSNETTGRLSTLDLSYTDPFTVYYLSMQDGEELLATTVHFIANIDRPVRADGSPVDVQGTNGLLYQAYTPSHKLFFLYDGTLLADNYTPIGGGPVTDVPPEAIALTNALLTATPPAGVILYGLLSAPDTFEKAWLLISFGLYYLIPSLPDPYASSFMLNLWRRRGGDIANDGNITKTLPLSDVTELLLGMVRWPAPANPASPQYAAVSFAILPLANNSFSPGAIKSLTRSRKRELFKMKMRQWLIVNKHGAQDPVGLITIALQCWMYPPMPT